jgi:hypothetical protein
MLVHAECIYSLQPARRTDAPDRFCLDGVPDGVPGDAELVGQRRDRGVKTLERVRRPVHRTGGQFRPGTGQRMHFGERGPRAVRIRAPPHALGPQKPHRPAETGNVMQTHVPAAVTGRDHAALRAAAEALTGFHAQQQARSGRRDRTDVDALDTKKRISPLAPATARTGSSIGHIRVSFELGSLVATNSKRP